MEVIQRVITYNRSDKFSVYPFSDLHDGSPGSATESFVHKVNECASLGRLGLALGNGDMLDCVTSKDKRWTNNCVASWVERTNIVESQRKHVEKLVEPITEQDQWLGWGDGNHEDAIHYAHDNNITRNICRDLKIPYAGYQAFYILHFERCHRRTHSLVIHSWHGDGAAQTEGARLMRLVRLVGQFEADIYLMGHLHAKTQHESARLCVRNGRIQSVPIKATITGSWLKAYNQPEEGEEFDPSYVEKKGYKPAVIGMPIIEIIPDNYNNPRECEFEIKS